VTRPEEPAAERAAVDFRALRAEQLEIARRAVAEGDLGAVRRFVAVDISSQPRAPGGDAPLYAAAVLLEPGSHEPLRVATAVLQATVPYVPGFLSFREAPAAMAALERLGEDFDLLWVDGHGLTHPRGAGIATHLGVLTGRASLGVAKKPLHGEFAEVGPEPGSLEAVRVRGEVRGYALRTRARALPVFVSAGHRCTPEAALAFVRAHLDGLRLPWPTRLAHDAANVARRAGLSR
jgi:deoxyribonuclease V